MSAAIRAFLASSPALVAASVAWVLGEGWQVTGIMLVGAVGVAIGYLDGAGGRRENK